MNEADEEIFVELDEDKRHQEIKDEHGTTTEGELDHLNQDGLEALVFATKYPVFVNEKSERY